MMYEGEGIWILCHLQSAIMQEESRTTLPCRKRLLVHCFINDGADKDDAWWMPENWLLFY